MKKKLLFISTVLAFTFPLRSFAASCEGYPEMDGVRTEVTEDGSFRTFSTVTVPVPIFSLSLTIVTNLINLKGFLPFPIRS